MPIQIRASRHGVSMRFLLMSCAAGLAWTQTMPADASRVLETARVKILRTSRNLPRYTCQETVAREYLNPPKHRPKSTESCPATDPQALVRVATDRLRLEVAVSEGREIHAWPGATKFDTRELDQMIGSGPLSTGLFGTVLGGIFDNPGTHFEFAAENPEGGRRLFHYRYSIPVSASHYQVKLMGGTWWNTSYSGDFDISVDTGDLEKLTTDTGSLSLDAQMCRAQTVVEYHYEKVGDGGFLIPRQATLRTFHPDGTSTLSMTTFSACHEYLAESTIRFDDADAPADANGNTASPSVRALPGWTPVTLKLATAIDTDTAAAGDVVWATLAKPVIDENKRVIAPAGLRVRGRILMVKHYLEEAPGFEIDLAFDRYERNSADGPFRAALLAGSARISGSQVAFVPLDEGGQLKFHTKAPKIILPAGIETKWITLTPSK